MWRSVFKSINIVCLCVCIGGVVCTIFCAHFEARQLSAICDVAVCGLCWWLTSVNNGGDDLLLPSAYIPGIFSSNPHYKKNLHVYIWRCRVCRIQARLFGVWRNWCIRSSCQNTIAVIHQSIKALLNCKRLQCRLYRSNSSGKIRRENAYLRMKFMWNVGLSFSPEFSFWLLSYFF